MFAAHAFALTECNVWAKLRAKQLNNYIALKEADKSINNVPETEI